MPKSKFVASHRLGPADYPGGRVAGATTAATAAAGTAGPAAGAGAVTKQQGLEDRPDWEDEEDGGEWEYSEEEVSRSPR